MRATYNNTSTYKVNVVCDTKADGRYYIHFGNGLELELSPNEADTLVMKLEQAIDNVMKVKDGII